jgi:hypothetical protein
MLSLRAHAIICGAIFALIVALAIIGDLVSGAVKNPDRYRSTAMAVFFSLTIALALSAVPVIVKAVLAGQMRAGNADQPVIRALAAHQNAIIWIAWTLMLLGLAAAIPAAVRDGFFTPT